MARAPNTKVGVYSAAVVHPRVKQGTVAQPNVNQPRNR